MIKNTYIIIVMILLSGCQSKMPDGRFFYLMKEAPLVSIDNLREENGIIYFNKEIFSGRTVKYEYGFELVLYDYGKETQLPSTFSVSFLPEQKSHDNLYRAAFRKHIDKDSTILAHDDFIVISEYGYRNTKDIPRLIECLKKYEHEGDGKGVICDHGHCRDALKSITGTNAGNNSSDWEIYLKTMKNN